MHQPMQLQPGGAAGPFGLTPAPAFAPPVAPSIYGSYAQPLYAPPALPLTQAAMPAMPEPTASERERQTQAILSLIGQPTQLSAPPAINEPDVLDVLTTQPTEEEVKPAVEPLESNAAAPVRKGAETSPTFDEEPVEEHVVIPPGEGKSQSNASDKSYMDEGKEHNDVHGSIIEAVDNEEGEGEPSIEQGSTRAKRADNTSEEPINSKTLKEKEVDDSGVQEEEEEEEEEHNDEAMSSDEDYQPSKPHTKSKFGDRIEKNEIKAKSVRQPRGSGSKKDNLRKLDKKKVSAAVEKRTAKKNSGPGKTVMSEKAAVKKTAVTKKVAESTKGSEIKKGSAKASDPGKRKAGALQRTKGVKEDKKPAPMKKAAAPSRKATPAKKEPSKKTDLPKTSKTTVTKKKAASLKTRDGKRTN